MEYLEKEQWQEKERLHRMEAESWTKPSLLRRSCHQPHPVEDFLFTYYPFKISKLEQWHPGYGVAIACTEHERPTWMEKHYRWENGWLFCDPVSLEEKERSRLAWMIDLLQRTANQTPNFGCFGMHEWAMIYRAPEARHQHIAPLRISQQELDTFVESRPIRCSHYDAFRFFTPQARPLNQLQPTLDGRIGMEQPACIHANMDLFKWASKSLPWVSSSLHWRSFTLAKELRDLDMRASPYDLRHFGYEPICIETESGRKLYESTQRQLAAKATKLRAELIDLLCATLSTASLQISPPMQAHV